MRLDRNYSAVIETQEEKEAIAEAIRRQIREKEEAEEEAEAYCETEDAERLEQELNALYDIISVLDRAIKGGAGSGGSVSSGSH